MLKTSEANSTLPTCDGATIFPATRITNRSPNPWPNTSSAGTRASEQPRTMANGCWLVEGRAGGPWWLSTKRRLPSRRRASASCAGIMVARLSGDTLDREAQRGEIADLDHQRGHAAVAALGVHLTAFDEGHLAGPDGVSHPVPALDPARPFHGREQLAEFSRMRPNRSTALEPNQIRMRLPVALTQLRNLRGATLILGDG